MTDYVINVEGCDDHTAVTVDLTDAEVATLERVASLITAASTYGCEPRMTITAVAVTPPSEGTQE